MWRRSALALTAFLLAVGLRPAPAQDIPNGWVTPVSVEAAICGGPLTAAGQGRVACPRPRWYPGPPIACTLSFALDPAGRIAAVVGRYFAPVAQALIRYDGCEGADRAFGGALLLDLPPGQPPVLSGFLPGAAFRDCLVVPAQGRPGLEEPLCLIISPGRAATVTAVQRLELTPQGARARDVYRVENSFGLGAQAVNCQARSAPPEVLAVDGISMLQGGIVRLDVLYADQTVRAEACRRRWSPTGTGFPPIQPGQAYLDPRAVKRGVLRLDPATGQVLGPPA